MSIEELRRRLDKFALALSVSGDRFTVDVHTLTTGRQMRRADLTLEQVETLADGLEAWSDRWPPDHRQSDGHGCLCEQCQAFYLAVFERLGIDRTRR